MVPAGSCLERCIEVEIEIAREEIQRGRSNHKGATRKWHCLAGAHYTSGAYNVT